MLRTLLYLKKIGNIIAHPYIERNVEAEFNKISRNIKKVEDLLEKKSNIINNHSINNNSLVDIFLKNDIKEILYKVKDDIV